MLQEKGVRPLSWYRLGVSKAMTLFPFLNEAPTIFTEENIGRLDVHLAPDELAEIDAILPPSGCRLALFGAGHADDQSVKVAAGPTAFPSNSLKSSAL